MDVFESIKRTFKQGDANIKLIYINVVVYLLINLVLLGFKLYRVDAGAILGYLAVPADLAVLLLRLWTPLTYMFLHNEFFHLFFNVLTLFWFGKIFLMYFSEKQLVGLYVIGGLAGALFYVLAFNLFPLFSTLVHVSLLNGASASIMAIVLASAVRTPDMELQLMLIGRVKLKYIATFFILTSVFGVGGDNSGGQLAHLGGALAGYLFVVSLRKGWDFTKIVSSVLDAFVTMFGPRKLRVKPNPHKRKATVSDADYNANKARRMAEIDKILDKIKTSGYNSLSTDEKKKLFEQEKKY